MTEASNARASAITEYEFSGSLVDDLAVAEVGLDGLRDFAINPRQRNAVLKRVHETETTSHR